MEKMEQWCGPGKETDCILQFIAFLSNLDYDTNTQTPV